MLKKTLLWFTSGALCLTMYWVTSCKTQETVDYSTQIKPILNKKCIACHGGVKKQGGWSLLFEEEAKAKLKSGKYAIVPGDVKASEMIRRLTLDDPEERMPFEHEALPQEEIELLSQWIKEGAKWGEHWAYQKVEKTSVLKTESDWVQNDIDHFVLHKASENGLEISPAAKPEILARRLSLDIIGFQKESATKDGYLENPTPANYEKLVDTLLASPHYGEKWTSMWLDLARYADTKGYERDGGRNIWRYRDWLINAFNADMPYDQFLTEQLAGDLLPNPKEEQYIATAFHRNTMTNDEGGTDNEEFRVAAVMDRVNTTWETVMGTTFACVQCHSHPYDGFKHEEYYEFMGFFNNTRDVDSYEDYPLIRHFDQKQKTELNELAARLKQKTSEAETQKIVTFIKTLQPSIASLESDNFINAELNDTKWLSMRNNSSARIPNVPWAGTNNLIMSYSSKIPGGKLLFHQGSPQGPVIGQLTLNHQTKGWEFAEVKLNPVNTSDDLYLSYSNPSIKNPTARGVNFNFFHFTNSFPDKGSKNLFWNLLEAKTESTPIMVDNTPAMSRETRVFERGSWLSLGEKVNPGTPDLLNDFSEEYPKNRLGLAKWMTSNENPLTARTIVNRLWEQVWGFGIVETLEDLGTQGETPSNQALLDHLSWKLMHEYDWKLKPLLKEILMSAAYQQDSKVTPEKIEKDPKNRWLARGPRIRLSAEQIRDQALAATTILNPKMYGPPVMPMQPDGIWLSPYNGAKWVESEGDEKYRRAVYTYWKRTSAYPSMLNFDAVGREVCSSRRIRTNTPLQALTTLNDEAYVDIAKQMAEQIGFEKPEENIGIVYRNLTGRSINAERTAALLELYKTALKSYQESEANQPEKDAMVLVYNAVLNLDEVLTKS
ncbi:DUF1553 domain-containing protein [uncultured Arcticibacterium sp.]|uniref:DUF1553 domain-containing protein n=1 Tax=uncultured Arcticibacterium sp. TaxID=2173042 RepID=UPI0030FB691E